MNVLQSDAFDSSPGGFFKRIATSQQPKADFATALDEHCIDYNLLYDECARVINQSKITSKTSYGVCFGRSSCAVTGPQITTTIATQLASCTGSPNKFNSPDLLQRLFQVFLSSVHGWLSTESTFEAHRHG
jgi:hypothetical protein